MLVQAALASGAEDGIPIGKLRRVSPTTADSRCIGNPKTPLCAIDTYYACAARLDHALCERVGVIDWESLIGQGPEGEADDGWYETTRFYTVKAREIVTRGWLESYPWPSIRDNVQPGSLKVSIDELACDDPGVKEPCGDGAPVDLFVTRSAGRWRVTALVIHDPTYGDSYQIYDWRTLDP